MTVHAILEKPHILKHGMVTDLFFLIFNIAETKII